jgi:NAD(P)-dependent dehydrogenase (short-subunit alcohol dehydrogenase family)
MRHAGYKWATRTTMQLDGKTILVTGSTDGVGRAVALALAGAGATVLVHGRDRGRGEAVLAAIRAGGRGIGAFYPADLASLAEVRALAAVVARDHAHLHVLVNNAGIGSASGGRARRTSADGHELRFAVNYLAGFLLTRLLLPLLEAGSPSRIVNVASAGQSAIDFDDVMLERQYDGGRAYTQSKLAQVMLTFDLAAELDGAGVTVNCLHPATYMDTTMVREAGVAPISSVAEGAGAVVRLAAAPELAGVSGRYFDRTREARAHAQAYDASARARLRALSVALTGLEAGRQSRDA